VLQKKNHAVGLQYSIVDMQEDGGKGDVVVRNRSLFGSACEKLAAIPHSNGCDIWIIGHEYNSSAFRAYRLSPNGIEPAVVLSDVGSPHAGLFPAAMNMMFPTNAVGQMATSSDGTKIAVAIHEDGIIEILDFDATNGRLSNPLTLNFQSKIYGLAFSPDKSKLYATVRRPVGGIYQFDLQANDILGSAILLGQPGGDGPGAIQLGPDGKLYIARWRQAFLAVVNQPNRLAPACDFVMDGIQLRRNITSELGLPEFMSSYLPVPAFNVYNSCEDAPIFFQFDDLAQVTSASWDFGDPGSGADNQSSLITPVHYFEDPGSYEVRLIRRYQDGRIDTSYQSVQIDAKPTVNLGNDTILCEGEFLDFDLTQDFKGINYLWSGGIETPVFQITEAGRYVARVENTCGNTADDIVVAYASPPQTRLGADEGLCPDSTLLLSYAPQELTRHFWQDGSQGESFLVIEPGIYSLRSENVCGVLLDSIQITEANCDCELTFSNVFTPNGDNINDVFAPQYNCSAQRYNLAIFDRWGRLIYQTDSQETPWEGACPQDECPDGVYFYQLEFQGDTRVTDSLELHSGSVTLFR